MNRILSWCYYPLRAAGRQWTLLRHSGGFGIHSPFAFSFVTRVLHEKAAYYAYGKLPRDRRWRTLYRVLLLLQPEHIRMVVSDGLRGACEVVTSLAAEGYVSPRGEMLIADRTSEAEALFDKAGDAHIILLQATAEQRAALRRHAAARGCGMIFDNCRGAVIYVSYSHLPQQNFIVGFKG